MQDLLLLLPVWLALAWLVSQLSWVWSNRPEFHFGWIVLLLCVFLLSEVWPSRPARTLRFGVMAWAGWIGGISAAMVAQFYAAAFGMSPAALLGFGAGVMGIVIGHLWYVMGFAGVRHFAFPIGFLWIAFPPPSVVANAVVNGLKAQITSGTVAILNLAGIPASHVGNLIQVTSGTVGVEDACSGVRSLQATLMATLFVSAMALKHWFPRMVLVMVGCVFAFVTNLARSVWLSVVAHRHGPGAVDAAHDRAGWSILAITLLGVFVASWALRRIELKLESMRAGGEQGVQGASV